MKYFFDTEFLEGNQNKTFLGFNYEKTKETIDLISIGVVSADNREYYAISKDFNLKEAWSRYDLKTVNDGRNEIKVYWIRENVLKPIFIELWEKSKNAKLTDADFHSGIFNYGHFKRLIKLYGKSIKQIEFEILRFTLDPDDKGFDNWLGSSDEYYKALKDIKNEKLEFYSYYGAYDWVVFCWIFGNMIGLPNSYPMYTKDLKQIIDEKSELLKISLDEIKQRDDYPAQGNEHNALDDAKWNKNFYSFIDYL